MIFNLIKDGSKHYLCMKEGPRPNSRNTNFFFGIDKLMFSNRLKSDKQHSIIEKELFDLVWTLKEGEDYSYEEMIRPLLRAAKLKNIGI